jgi:hypothetical protein
MRAIFTDLADKGERLKAVGVALEIKKMEATIDAHVQRSRSLVEKYKDETERSERAEVLREEGRMKFAYQKTREMTAQAHEYRKQGQPELAEPIAREVEQISAGVIGNADPLTVHRRNNLVLTLLMTSNYEDAKYYLQLNQNASAKSYANTTPRVYFLMIVVPLLEARSPARSFLGNLKHLIKSALMPASSLEQTSSTVSELKGLLAGDPLETHPEIGVPWDILYFIEFLRPKLGEYNAAFLTALVAAMNDRAKLPELDQFPEWREAKLEPLE